MDKADSSRQVIKWETLDRDILALIFGKLDVRDLYKGASRVCISWFLASHNKNLWNTLDLAKLQQVDKGLVRLMIMKLFGYTEACTSLRNVTKFSRSAPKNLSFNLRSYIVDEDLMFAAQRMPNIEKLVLPRWCFQTNESFRFAFSQWKNLKTLIIAHEYVTGKFVFQAVGESCRNLTNLKYIGYLDDRIAKQIVRYLQSLKRLSLRYSFFQTSGVFELITGLQNLEILNLSHCKNFHVSNHPQDIVPMGDLVQAATQKLQKFIECSKNNCTVCKRIPSYCMFWSYVSKHWRDDEIKELEF